MRFQKESAFFAKFKKDISNIKLGYKIMAAFIVITFIPIISLGVFSYYKLNEIILNQNKNSIITELNQIKQNINNNFDICLEISQGLYSSRAIENFISRNYNDDIEIFDAYKSELSPTVDTVLINHKMVKDIVVYTYNSTLNIDSSNIAIIDEKIPDYDVIKDLQTKRIIWKNEGLNALDGGKPVFYLYRLLNYFKLNKPSGMIRISIYEDYLYSLIKEESQNKDIFVIDSSGNVITSNKRHFIGKYLGAEEFVSRVMKSGSEGNFFVNIQKNNFIAAFNTLKNGWKVIVLINKDSLLEGTKSTVGILLFVSMAIIVVLVLLARFLSIRLTTRINHSIRRMQEIETGNTQVVLEESGDEIGLLNKSFNAMIEKLNTLISEIYITNIRKKEAQIEALQSQINPHFLFNTLESIRMRIMRNGDTETAEVIKLLAKLFRTRLDFDEHVIPLEKEIKLVEDYIKIQIYRFGNRISFINKINEKYYSNPIPKLTLQPLVENAIIHGIEEKEDGGVIILDASAEGECLKITVADNGMGIEATTLKAVNDAMDMNLDFKTRKSIGITNVHERLKLYYGNKYGLKIYSETGLGTTISVYIPWSCEANGKKNQNAV